MTPALILRAYRRTWVVVQLGIQGPIRIRRARQRNRFLMWLYAWAERGCPPLVIEMELVSMDIDGFTVRERL